MLAKTFLHSVKVDCMVVFFISFCLMKKFDIQQGEAYTYGDYEFKVVKIEGRHIQLVQITIVE